jgi:hypothetical protein
MQHRFRFTFTFGILLLHFLAGNALAVSPNEIVSAVESRYKFTIPGFLGDYKEIGSVLAVQKEGLRANRPRTNFKATVIKGGEIIAAGGGDLPLGNNVDGNLKIGDRLYLYGVKSGDDYVELQLFTIKTFVVTGSGTKGPLPLQASTRFRYEGGLAAVTAKKVMGDIGAWFKTEGGATDIAEPAVKDETKTKDVAEPGNMATRTVQLGQTPEDVIAILGSPDKKVLLGNKTVFVYRNLKLVFIDGRLTDAE